MSEDKTTHLKSDKKVEYVELIYDLIFVFLLHQNNSLLKLSANGFFGENEFMTYLYSTLIVLEVWIFTVMYINRYGENSFLDHVFLFANMYLLYYMGVQTRLDWGANYQIYNTAWGLILVNLAIQYLLKARRVRARHPKALRLTLTRALLYLIDAGMVFLTIPIFHATQVSLVWLALLIGFVGPLLTYRIEHAVPISSEHLSERVMLFVVFTFGEMIVSISSYFQQTFTAQVGYFSLAGFLVVVGLFMGYGYLYNEIMNRKNNTNGKIYLLLHVPIVLALSNVSVSLEHMREPVIDAVQNSIFISWSLVAYYFTLFFIARRTEHFRDSAAPFLIPALMVSGAFVAVTAIASTNSWIVIGACAAYTLGMFAVIVLRWRVVKRKWTDIPLH